MKVAVRSKYAIMVANMGSGISASTNAPRMHSTQSLRMARSIGNGEWRMRKRG